MLHILDFNCLRVCACVRRLNDVKMYRECVFKSKNYGQIDEVLS